jgi:gliding motility-associated protein GldM
MLALNMSKEVLSAFGLMNENFESSNQASLKTNEGMLAALEQKGKENAAQFGKASQTAAQVAGITKNFYAYIESLKSYTTKGVDADAKTGKLNYEAMDKAPAIDDNGWFSGDGYTAKGKEIVSTIDKYKADMKAAIGNETKLKSVMAEIDAKFSTADVKDKEGVTKKFLSYHFEHFPAIASLTKLSAYQNAVKKAEADIYSILLGKAAVEAASFSNYQAIVVLDKNAYFQGEHVTGKVVLGRYDENTKPTSFQGPGRLEKGQAVISLTAGGVGEQNINGQFTFVEEGKTIPLKFAGKYVVVPRPSQATISADKMNVVYRGVVNPMSISFAGVSDSDVRASAPGLTKASGTGKYNMSPGSGSEVAINVTAKLPDGKVVSDKKVYRIKNIPPSQGAIAGEIGTVKGTKSRLEVSQIMAKMVDFDFDVSLRVTQFSFKVPGQPTVIVPGDRVNAQCKAALARATKGDQILISDIKTKMVGSDAMTSKTAPVIYELN